MRVVTEELPVVVVVRQPLNDHAVVSPYIDEIYNQRLILPSLYTFAIKGS